MSKKDYDNCYYCGATISLLSKNEDHFPTPRSVEGNNVVQCCISCHDMKDRYPLDRWPEKWIKKVYEDFDKFNRETKLFIAKVLRISTEKGLVNNIQLQPFCKEVKRKLSIYERRRISKQVKLGLVRAKKNGKTFGRKPLEILFDMEEVHSMHKGGMGFRKIAKNFNVTNTWLWKKYKEKYPGEEKNKTAEAVRLWPKAK